MARKKGIICTGEGEGGKKGGNRREFEVKWSSYVWPLTGVFLQRSDYILFCTGALHFSSPVQACSDTMAPPPALRIDQENHFPQAPPPCISYSRLRFGTVYPDRVAVRAGRRRIDARHTIFVNRCDNGWQRSLSSPRHAPRDLIISFPTRDHIRIAASPSESPGLPGKSTHSSRSRRRMIDLSWRASCSGLTMFRMVSS